tara:strand:+ start:9131 stop:9418 length:288 start_codon:yes stop_codon:yes gene_type:complete
MVEPSTDVIGYADPIEDARYRPAGESELGVALRKMPQAMLRDAPELWTYFDRFSCGWSEPPSCEEYETLNNHAIEAQLIMCAAKVRRQKNEAKDG